MQAEIISIGTELVLGQILDTNAVYLSQQLQRLGFDVFHRETVDDNEQRICEVLCRSLSRSQVVVISGGLGPTKDDITRDAVAKMLKTPLVIEPKLISIISQYFNRVLPGQQMPKNNLLQAYVPRGASYFINQRGTAPGLFIERKISKTSRIKPSQNKQYIIILPGPPRELEPMWENQVVPELKKRINLKAVIKYRVLKVVGMSESAIDEQIQDFMVPNSNPEVGLMAVFGQIDIRITARAKSVSAADRIIKKAERVIRKRIGNAIYGADKDMLEGVIGSLLRHKKLRLAIAESCTGGLIANRITNISGSSDYFDRGLVVYSNQAKQDLLGVPKETIKNHGAVSEPTAISMVQGLLKQTKADIGISVTGIAGPTGGTPDKPVGLVYIALATANRYQHCVKYNFNGDREMIKWRTSQVALNLLRHYLLTIN
ncbi:MAG: competence/damage-inducible protein A [bacterium]